MNKAIKDAKQRMDEAQENALDAMRCVRVKIRAYNEAFKAYEKLIRPDFE